MHFPAPFVVGPKLANKCPGGKLPLHPLQGREQEGPYLSPSLSMIPVPHSLWNFIMFPGSTEVWQLRTDLAGRRRARLTCRSLPALRVSPQSAAAEYRGPGTEALQFSLELLLSHALKFQGEGTHRTLPPSTAISYSSPRILGSGQTRLFQPWDSANVEHL